MSKPKTYSPEVRERAVRMVFEHAPEYPSQWAAIQSIAEKIGCSGETLRSWVRRTERDQGKRAGLTTDVRAPGKVRERRDQLRHPNYARPELLAQRPNELWSWDITKLLGPEKWSYYYLYVILDVFSRYVVGWTVQYRESAAVAEQLIAQAVAQQGIERDQLTIHADRGSAMTSKPVAFLLADLGITKTHSRPYTSTDNPYSEAQFKTLKYQEHRHSGIGLMPPEAVHSGRAEALHDARSRVLAAAYEARPERFLRGLPRPPALPTAAWINPPKKEEAAR